MIRATILLSGLLLLSGCVSAPQKSEDYSKLALSDGELLQDKWQGLNRTAAIYPLQAAQSRTSGCATVEYVITPEYQIRNLIVTEASNRVFNKSAKAVVSRWDWSGLPKGLLSAPVKTQTRFNYCIESEDISCAEVMERFSCSGDDSLAAIGSIVKQG